MPSFQCSKNFDSKSVIEQWQYFNIISLTDKYFFLLLLLLLLVTSGLWRVLVVFGADISTIHCCWATSVDHDGHVDLLVGLFTEG